MKVDWESKFENLKYYDSEMSEGSELFLNICSLAYQATGIMDNASRIPFLYDWAKEICVESEEYKDENNGEYVEYIWGE